MAVNDFTLSGNLTGDPVHKVTASGRALTDLRVAHNRRVRDPQSGVWEDREPLYVSVTCWGRLAENVARSLRKGDEVLVVGRLRQHDWVGDDGQRRTKLEVDADLVGAGLGRAVARPVKQRPDPQSSRVSAHVAAGADLDTGEALQEVPDDVRAAWDDEHPLHAPRPDADEEDEDLAGDVLTAEPEDELVGASG